MNRNDGVYPPSVKPGRPRIERFPQEWMRVPYGCLLEPALRPIRLDPTTEYQLIVAKRNRGGIAPREVLLGGQIRTEGQYLLKEGDFVIAKRQIVHGACGLVPGCLDGAIVSGEYDVFRTKNELDAEFLSLFSHTDYFQQTCFHSSVGVTVEKLIFRTERWLRFEMPLPSPREQEAIVRIGKLFDRRLNALGTALATKGSFRRGLMQRLLTGQKRFPKFVGRPWPLAKVGDVVDIDPESLPQRTPGSHAFHYIDVSSVSDGICLIPAGKICFADAPTRARRIVRKHDVLMSTVRPNLRGFCRIEDDRSDLVASTGFAVLRPESEADSRYLLECLFSASFMRQVMARVAGSSFPAISSGELAKLEIPWPEADERKRIGHILATSRRELDLLAAQRDRIAMLRRSLLSRLLDGSLRVPV